MTTDPGHLGERVSALVDGALDHDTRDRLLAHLAGCADCRAVVEDERRVKTRLTGLVDPRVPPGLVDRLLHLGDEQPTRDAVAVPAMATRPDAAPAAPTRPRSRDDARRPAARQRHTRRNRLVAGTGGVLAAALSLAFVLGGNASGGQRVTPQVDQFTVDHAAVTSEVPLTGPAGNAVTASFAHTGSP
jgi:anti-sigma factor RsiW